MEPITGGNIIMVAVGVLFIYGIIKINKMAGRSTGKKVKCPRCNKYGMEPKGGRYYRNGLAGSDWECPFCGHMFFNRSW